MNKIFKKFVLLFGAFLLCLCAGTNVSLASELTFAQVSDIHYSLTRPDTEYKLLSKSEPLLRDAVSQINKEKGVDFVVLTGDFIDKPQEDSLDGVIDNLNKLKAPTVYVVGNHDTSPEGYVTKDVLLKTLKHKSKGYTFDSTYYAFNPKNDITVIVLDGALNDRRASSGYIPQEQLDFLDSVLKKSKKKTVLIFSHFPILPPYGAKNHEITNVDEVKKIINKYSMPIAIFSGHYHMTKITKRGNVLHVSTPSLVGYPNAFRIIKVDNNRKYVSFDIQLKETGLETIHKQAKIVALGGALYSGRETDRNNRIVIYRKRK